MLRLRSIYHGVKKVPKTVKHVTNVYLEEVKKDPPVGGITWTEVNSLALYVEIKKADRQAMSACLDQYDMLVCFDQYDMLVCFDQYDMLVCFDQDD